MLKNLFQKFWSWYERHYALNVGIAAALFTLQLIHLWWLSADVVALRLVGVSYFPVSEMWRFLIIAVDYTEIPAIISTSLVYMHALQSGSRWRPAWMLFFINSQWLHIFWITDEFVITQFTGTGGTALPVWLAWVAIVIDYLELPVIYETLKKFLIEIRERRAKEFLAKGSP